MDIQRDEAFEAEFKKTDFYKNMLTSLGNSDCPFTEIFEMINGKYRSYYIQLSHEIWQVAKASVVPVGFVMLSIEDVERACRCLDEHAIYITYKASDALGNISKAMIDAQEQSND